MPKIADRSNKSGETSINCKKKLLVTKAREFSMSDAGEVKRSEIRIILTGEQ